MGEHIILCGSVEVWILAIGDGLWAIGDWILVNEISHLAGG